MSVPAWRSSFSRSDKWLGTSLVSIGQGPFYRPLLQALNNYTYRRKAMYSIGNIVFGWDLCLDEEWEEAAEVAFERANSTEGVMTWHHGSAPTTVIALGVKLGTISERDNINLKGLFDRMNGEVDMALIDKAIGLRTEFLAEAWDRPIPEEAQEILKAAPGLYIIWSTS